MTRLLFLLVALIVFSPQAQAAEAYALAKVNLRAGPDGGYPVVDILKRNERVELLGCIRGWQWCEVETRSGEHGWVYAHYLTTNYQGRSYTIVQTNGHGVSIITFNPNYYWDNYYRYKYFYPNRYQWIPRDRNDGHGHGHGHHDHDDDDDDHGHHGGGNGHGGGTPVVTQPEPPKYDKMPTPSRKKYNPLCAMGETEC